MQFLQNKCAACNQHMIHEPNKAFQIMGGICPGGGGVYVWGVCVLWGMCPGGKCPGGKCPGGKCPGGICPGGKCPGGFCPVTNLVHWMRIQQ